MVSNASEIFLDKIVNNLVAHQSEKKVFLVAHTYMQNFEPVSLARKKCQFHAYT
jgi:hypothetical protein